MNVWRPMKPSDLAAVHAIAETIHLDHPEDFGVLAERQRLFPQGCQVLESDGVVKGYAISHPGEFGKPPALNTLLESLPAHPTTYYLHDVAILPEGRAAGHAAFIVDLLIAVARETGLDNLSLVAVNASRGFWERLGFAPTDLPGLSTKLASYKEAVFMVRKMGNPTLEPRAG